jgi:hypothetical protein
VVPQVEEIGSEANVLPLADFEMLQEGYVPVLLKRSVVEVAAQVAESGGTEIRIGETLRRIKLRRRSERCGIQVSVGNALVKVAA